MSKDRSGRGKKEPCLWPEIFPKQGRFIICVSSILKAVHGFKSIYTSLWGGSSDPDVQYKLFEMKVVLYYSDEFAGVRWRK